MTTQAEWNAERDLEKETCSFYRTHLWRITETREGSLVDLPVVAWWSGSGETIQVGDYEFDPFEALMLVEVLTAAVESLRSEPAKIDSEGVSSARMVHPALGEIEQSPLTDRQRSRDAYFAQAAINLQRAREAQQCTCTHQRGVHDNSEGSCQAEPICMCGAFTEADPIQ